MNWDESTDVVVAGCGFAGAMTAITASDAAARVLLLEKMPDPGGISICSFGGVRTAKNAGAALKYLERTNGGTTPIEVLGVLAQGMTELPSILSRLAVDAGAVAEHHDAAGNYPFEGSDTFGFVGVAEIKGFDLAKAYLHVEGAPGGRRLFHVIERNLSKRSIVPRTNARVEQVVRASDGGADGVLVRIGGRLRAIEAKRAVVLACGGFEGDPRMQRQYWPEQPVLNAAFRGNTGDGIRMAQALGADLWHMWHYHGSYGFKHPDPAYPFGVRTKRLPDWVPGSGPGGEVRMPWVLIDRSGRRFMNEYDPYVQDTGARPFARYDPLVQDFAAIPAWLIADDAGSRLWPFGRPTWNERGVRLDWGPDNERAFSLGILRRARTLDELAATTSVPAQRLAATLARWNELVRNGLDDDHGRPPPSMAAISEPPFVFAPVWPIVSNTQGGPVHDARQRVLRPDGTPIPRLYAVGELGSVFGHLYLSGGNIAECFVGGRVAGREAAASRR